MDRVLKSFSSPALLAVLLLLATPSLAQHDAASETKRDGKLREFNSKLVNSS